MITDKMIYYFNKIMQENHESPIKLVRNKEIEGVVNITIEDKFIEYLGIELSDEFYDILNNFFSAQGIKLSFNNTGLTIWATID